MTQRHTLLVVDDEPDVVKSVQDLLRFDYRVLGATRAQDGLRIMRQEEVHVVMTDQRMPGMTGVEFLREVRGDYPEAIRLLFTGYADIRAVIDAINAGNVYRYITKPWDPEELQGVIREACERYDLLAERKRLMADLQRKNAELERANQELHRANARLLEASQLKSAFIEVASHELRTPLTILHGLTDLAARVPNTPEPLKGWLARMRAACERLERLVDQIVTQLSAGRFDHATEKAPVELPPLLATAADDVQPFADLRKQALVRCWPDDLGSVDVEPEQMRDAVNHLLLNAIKFTPDGGQITLAASRGADGGVEIRVTDTGVGIAPADQKHIFDPFFTGMNVERHSSGQFEYGRQGLGLGLSVVKAFVERDGGTLNFQSEPGRGSTFTIRLPAGPPSSDQRPADARAVAPN